MSTDKNSDLSRRDLMVAAGLAAGAITVGLPLLHGADTPPQPGKLKILVAGGHPDDPESACGGTMARYADLGHDVTALYLTRGEAGLKGKTHQEAAAIRTAEAEKACEILKAKALFASQIDGSTEINDARYDDFRKILDAEKSHMLLQ